MTKHNHLDIRIEPLGNLGNRMMQYMSALKLANYFSNVSISNVYLPEWNISTVGILNDVKNIVVNRDQRKMDLGISKLSRILAHDHVDQYVIGNYCIHLSNFLSAPFYNEIFKRSVQYQNGFDDAHLVINIRGAEILTAVHPDYTVLPISFYKEIIEKTRLKPVFMGQVSNDIYSLALKAAFPDALFLSSSSAMNDFSIIRESANIVLSVSTFSWLAAWLSNAKRIFFPITGFYNPMQFPEIDLLPTQDKRYDFYLFPINYSVPLDQLFQYISCFEGLWRQIDGKSLEKIYVERPRFGFEIDDFVEAFDEKFYLASYPDVAAVVQAGDIPNGWHHFFHHGYHEMRYPFAFDQIFYTRTYPLAAFEVAQGDYLDLRHHYVKIGKRRGYRSTP